MIFQSAESQPMRRTFFFCLGAMDIWYSDMNCLARSVYFFLGGLVLEIDDFLDGSVNGRFRLSDLSLLS